MVNTPVDAIITWVDGHDPVHKDKLATRCAALGLKQSKVAPPTRFNQCGELNYCVRSILRFAPWIRTIYIVTDAQTPPIFEELRKNPYKNKLKLVDHQEIFAGFEQHLPTFNSLTIESMLWRIQGLSNQFIYFNDDCFLVRPVTKKNFFCDDKIVLRGKWKVQSDKQWRYYLAHRFNLFMKKNDHRRIQENSAKRAGLHRHFFDLPHAPFPMLKQVLEDFFLNNPGLVQDNIRYPFRDLHQFMPISLGYHLAIQENRVMIDHHLKEVMVNGACHDLEKIKQRLDYADKEENVAFVCMQSLDEAPLSTREWMLQWLEKKI